MRLEHANWGISIYRGRDAVTRAERLKQRATKTIQVWNVQNVCTWCDIYSCVSLALMASHSGTKLIYLSQHWQSVN